MAEFMLQKIMGETFLPKPLVLDIEPRGHHPSRTISRDSTKRVQRPDGDQYNFLPPRDVSERASCAVREVFDIELYITPTPLPPIPCASGRRWERSFLT